MIIKFLKNMLGSSNDRILKTMNSTVAAINSLEKMTSEMSDDQLRDSTYSLKQNLENGSTFENILPQAFANVREAAKRTLGIRHFDVQLMGGIALHHGMIAEMRTGEGKTLVATLPAYLNALDGKGVHMVTINDYLVSRDASWMGRIYQLLGLTVGSITQSMTENARRESYNADITYGTNNEFGFDYLRDNLKYKISEMVQRDFHYAIVDEVDSVLIDEARTPLIISGRAENNSKMYYIIQKVIEKLHSNHYEIEEKSRSIMLSDSGCEEVEKVLHKQKLLSEDSSLYDVENMKMVHHVNQALKAQYIYIRDKDYIVQEDKIMIIDEFTGRVMDGRRYSDGLHSAIEAKENVSIQHENQTIASITYQNYFRMYKKIAGMTGTAMTESAEFADIYKLQILSIPTNIPIARKDEDDVVYRTAQEKYNAIVNEIINAHSVKQPILVGTISIEKSEYLSSLLHKHKIKHNILNAKYHEQEAEIIAQAGRLGAVTIATNMAGRGTDIRLGGNVAMLVEKKCQEKFGNKSITDEQHKAIYEEITAQVEHDQKEVKKVGGLLVIGTERHESRRIDDQLRGRTGRQGDPGTTKFFLSMEDDLMRLFGSEKLSGFLLKMGLKEGEAIIHPWVSKSLAKAQQKVESRNYDMRKNLLQYDDVMNEQRQIIYTKRLNIMSCPDTLSDTLIDMANSVLDGLVTCHIPKGSYEEQWDIVGLNKELQRIYGFHITPEDSKQKNEKEMVSYLEKKIYDIIHLKQEDSSITAFSEILQALLLSILDALWKDHLHSLDHLRSGINLRAYGQKNPLTEYKMEAFTLFKGMLTSLEEQFVHMAFHVHLHKNSSEQKDRTKINSHSISNEIDKSLKISEQNAKSQSSLKSKLGLKKINKKSSNTANNSTLSKVDNNKDTNTTNTDDIQNPVNMENSNECNFQNKSGNLLEYKEPYSRNSPCPCGSEKKYKYCHGAIT